MAELSGLQKEHLLMLGLKDAIYKRRILVTGASGFIGLHLCEALADLGAEVFALSRSSRSFAFPKHVHARPADLRNLKATRQIIESIKPALVYHLAGVVNARQDLKLVIPTFKNNLAGSVNLFIALAEKGCEQIVTVGSSEEPDLSRFGISANSPYAAAKDAATTYARMFHKVFSLPVVVARPYMCYGPRQPVQKIIPYTITSLLKGIPPKISSGKRICDLIYVQDLIMGLLMAGFRPGLVGEVVDLGTGVGTTIHDAVQLIAELVNYPRRLVFGTLPDRLFEYPQIADIEKTIELLGFRPNYSLREGLKATIEWYRANYRR